MKIAVLGSGPAGLFAAHGAQRAAKTNKVEADITIYSLGKKSPLYGAQYLHSRIPGVTTAEPTQVSYQLRGSADDYRRKVYGTLWDGTVSPEDLADEHPAWDIRATYDLLWDRWSPSLRQVAVDPIGLRSLLQTGKPDLVINSIPRNALCHEGHMFAFTEVWAAGDAPDLGIRIPFQCPPDMVICNAEDNPAWYRMSRVFGHTTVEWPGFLGSVPVTTASRVQKPTKHNCTCWSKAPMIHVGRYGEWNKGVLSHTAYRRAFDEVAKMVKGVGNASAEASA